MRGLISKIKCGACPYRKQCHSELGDIARLQEKVKSLTFENTEYEREIDRLHSQIRILDDMIDKIAN